MLPAFTAGAHTNVLLPSGLIRQYSLFNDAAETHRYCIAVQRENNGQGGSIEMHEKIRVGDCLQIGNGGAKLVHGSGGIVSLRAEQNSAT